MVKKKIKINTKATREIDTGLIFYLTAHGKVLKVVRKQSYLFVLLKVIY